MEFEPVNAERIHWNGNYSDVLVVDANIRDSDGNVRGFDTWHIRLGGTALPSFASCNAFSDFFEPASTITPPRGPVSPGREFQWAEATGLKQIDGNAAGETIKGARSADVIYGYAGYDWLRDRAGNDAIHGRNSNDRN